VKGEETMREIIDTLNVLFGVAWMPAAMVVALGAIDLMTGSFLCNMYFAFIDLDNYPTLWDKYHDPDREVFREVRNYAYENYRMCMSSMIHAHQFREAWKLRRVRKHWDYLTLYYMELAWDGDVFARRWLKEGCEGDDLFPDREK